MTGVQFPAEPVMGFLSLLLLPDQLWGPPTLLFVRYWGLCPRGEAVRSWSCHSLPSSAKVKNDWSYTSTPPIQLHGVVLN